MSAPLLVIAAGGTGGHMFPAQALAEVMLARGWRVVLSTDQRGASYAGGFPPAVERRVVASASFARGGILGKLKAPLVLFKGLLDATAQMRRDRPACVVGFGGYPAFPAMGAATLLRLPRLIHEQNGVMGRVNALFAPYVSAVACGVWPTLKAGRRACHVGNPVRDAVLVEAGQPYLHPQADGPLRLVVFGGSQGAQVFSDVVPAAVSELPERLRQRLKITQQARPEDADHVRAAYSALGIAAEIAPFFEELPKRIVQAHIVISRSGASSVADITVLGRPSLLVPYAFATADHQTANAKPLMDAGAAIMLPQSGLTSAAVSEHLKMLFDAPERLGQMAERALESAKPDAAATLADLVEDISKGAGS